MGDNHVAQETALPVESPQVSLPGRLIQLLPGLLLLFVIGFAGKFIQAEIKTFSTPAHPLPDIEYVLWAILIGLIISNTVGVHPIFQPGVATYEFFLKLGIVLLGARFLLGDVFKLGGVSLLLVGLEFVVAIGLMTALGRFFKLKPKLISLLAIGSSICGISAIIAGQGAIEADNDDAAFAIAAIMILSTFGLFAYPVIGHAVNMSDKAFGLWAGLAVDNTAEATATGSIFSQDAGNVATLAKTARNATIGFVVLGYALYWASRGQAKEVTHKAAFLWQKFPKFVLGFLIVSLIATLGLLSKGQISSVGNLSRWAFLFTFAGVGLKINFREMQRQGWRPFIVGAIAELVITIATFGMVYGAQVAHLI
jgi:uncharacterized integral membrane protein (TIGR00698 family)